MDWRNGEKVKTDLLRSDPNPPKTQREGEEDSPFASFQIPLFPLLKWSPMGLQTDHVASVEHLDEKKEEKYAY